MRKLTPKSMRRFKWAAVIGLFALAVPGNSCGPFFPEGIFVSQRFPDDVAAFLNGNIGIVQTSFIPRYLALSYRILSGLPLTAAEKSAALKGWQLQRGSDGDEGTGAIVDPALSALGDTQAAWTRERAQVADAASAKIPTDRAVAGSQWETYSNCLADAFAYAARTLAARAHDHPAEKAALADWVQGQDAVFSNCAGNGAMPNQAAQPAWLAQDRAYQTAAAHFYRSEFAPAQTIFEQIAADRASPHHALAAYMAGRCLLRSASLQAPGEIDQDLLGQAADRFRQIAQGGGPYAAPAVELLNMIELRTSPGVAAARLGDAISKPDIHLAQHLVDLAYVHDNALTHEDDARRSDLVDWELTMEGLASAPKGVSPQTAALKHAAERWRQTGNVAWLVAALSKLDSPDPDLVRAAAAVPLSSPAWVSLTYYRLKLLPAGAPARTEIENVLAQLKSAHAPRNAINLFTVQARQKAESPAQYARLAPMEQVAEDDDGYGPLPNSGGSLYNAKRSTMAGLAVNVAGVERIDFDSAVVFNRQLPLSDLVSLVLDSKWTKQLRFELAMAVWTRAVLLDQPDQARRLTAVMVEGEPGWQPWLTAYDDATTPDERHVTALLALMRFPSVRPYINAGAGREEGFAAYSSYRDNWWCAGMGWPDYNTGHNFSAGYEDPNQVPSVAAPGFVTPATEASARQELAALERIPDAPEYFGTQALAWVSAHPADKRNADLLGFALRAMRNGCNLERTTPLRQQVFNLLHKNYPNSSWAKTYRELPGQS
jgi:hypothetical protein